MRIKKKKLTGRPSEDVIKRIKNGEKDGRFGCVAGGGEFGKQEDFNDEWARQNQ